MVGPKRISRNSFRPIWKWLLEAHSKTFADRRQERNCITMSQKHTPCRNRKSTIWLKPQKSDKKSFTEPKTEFLYTKQCTIMTSSHQVAQEQKMESAPKTLVCLTIITIQKLNTNTTQTKCRRRRSSMVISRELTILTMALRLINLVVSYPRIRSPKTSKTNQTTQQEVNLMLLTLKVQSREGWETPIANLRIITTVMPLSLMIKVNFQDFQFLITTNK